MARRILQFFLVLSIVGLGNLLAWGASGPNNKGKEDPNKATNKAKSIFPIPARIPPEEIMTLKDLEESIVKETSMPYLMSTGVSILTPFSP